MSIACLVQVRNEERFLPGFLAHVAPHVDGIIALDDCSSDATQSILAREPKVVSLLREDRAGRAHANETSNRHRLILEAARLGAHWALCADADERFEERFLRRLRREAEGGDARGQPVLFVKLANLWDSPHRYRLDGPCGPRWTARMFRLPDTITRRRPGMHQPWFPPELDDAPRGYLRAVLYHLRMIDRHDREARLEKFRAADPDARDQSMGYDHLTDETGLTLRDILPFRRYVDPIPAVGSFASASDRPGLGGDPEFLRRFQIAGGAPARTGTLAGGGRLAGMDFAAVFADVRARAQ